MPKKTDPSKRSLREIPEVDFASARRLPRGKYSDKAWRSFAVVIVAPELFAGFGSSEAINGPPRAGGRRSHREATEQGEASLERVER
jgi:hypothetical protein